MMCDYSDHTDYKCPHESLEDSNYCIFHLQDDNKNVDEFNSVINELLETEEDSINFRGFYFPLGTSDFSKRIFQKSVIFMGATFSGKADFFDANFLGEANFSSAMFNKMADFTDATFSGNAVFFDATFLGETIFQLATFSGEANFGMATINEAYFWDVTFSGLAIFSATKFIGEAYFKDATFTEVNFRSATFIGKANFKDAIFVSKADFSDATISDLFVLIPDDSKTVTTIDFNKTYFSDSVRIKANLGQCSFIDSNIERVDMTDSVWIADDKTKNSYSVLIEWFKNKVGLSETSIKIWEEHQGYISSDWKKLEGIYRRLKQSYQKYGDNDTAGNFYYQEMECKRKQMNFFPKLFWNIFYKKLCGYGEKPFNVIWASLFIIFTSAFSFLFGGIEFLGSEMLNKPAKLIQYNLSLNSNDIHMMIQNFDSLFNDFLLCVYTSFITFTTLGYGDVHPIGWSRLVATIESGLGIFMTALFIFVFTRKMLR